MNKISGSLACLDVKLGNITQAIEKEVLQVGHFVEIYLQLDSIIQAIRRTVWQANFYVEHVQLQLNMLSLGHLSPLVITPKKFEGFTIRNRESLTTVFKVTVWLKRRDLEVISDSYLCHTFG